MKTLRKWLNVANKLEEALVILVFIIMILASFAQVINRNILQLPIGWLEELARYMQVYLALLAMELGLREGSQMSITAITDKLHGNVKAVVALLAKCAVVTITVLLFINSITILQVQMGYGQRSPGLKIEMYLPYIALPLSFGIASLIQGASLLQMFLALFKKSPDIGEEVAP